MPGILIIEDDADIAAVERDYLEAAGYAVQIAPEGKSGLTLGEQDAFDLILLDLMLPDMDGFTVCRLLREKTDVPILMVTARQEDIDKIHGLGLGADDYIEKPFSPSVLVARVRASGALRTADAGEKAPKGDLHRRHSPEHGNQGGVCARTAGGAQEQGIRAAALLHAQSGHRLQQGAHLRRGLGDGCLRGQRDRRGARQPAAGEA